MKVNALLNQIRDEMKETRDDIREIIAGTYASEKWLKEFDYIHQELPLLELK